MSSDNGAPAAATGHTATATAAQHSSQPTHTRSHSSRERLKALGAATTTTSTTAEGLLSVNSHASSAMDAFMASPLASTHSKFPLPGDPGYIKPYVFLGGSCDPTTWRSDIAVPRLSAKHIAFFNPQISGWHPNLIQLEAKAKEVCSVLLFVIDSKTRAIASMLEATEYIMSQRRVVIVILDIPEGGKIDGELIGGRQLKDLNRARAFLCDIAARHQKYCDVFDSVENAVNHIILTYKPSQ